MKLKIKNNNLQKALQELIHKNNYKIFRIH